MSQFRTKVTIFYDVTYQTPSFFLAFLHYFIRKNFWIKCKSRKDIEYGIWFLNISKRNDLLRCNCFSF